VSGLLTPRRLAAAAAAVAVILTSGCATGFDAGTRQDSATGDGVDRALENGLGVRGAILVHSDSNSALVATLKNSSDRDDALIGVEISGAGTQSIGQATLNPSPIDIPARGTVSVGLPANEARITLTGVPERPSQYVNVVFVFRDAGRLETQLLSTQNAGYYADINVD
jgi:phage gpG-like protein